MSKMGVPVLKLKAGYGHGKHSGNAKAIACEGLQERRSADPDLDKTRTNGNFYGGRFRSGEELAEYWISEADKYRVIDKNGKEKKLRSDANIGFASIFKPDKSFMESLSPEEQLHFVKDVLRVANEEYKKRGLVVDACVIHTDEQVIHPHVYGHDPKYQLGKKLNLSFFTAMNKRVPERLRALGWNIESCTVYDAEEVKNMPPDEQEAYKKKRMEEKKAKGYGTDSKTYKAKKDREKLDQEKAAFEQEKALFGQRVREEAMKLAESMHEQETIQREETKHPERRLPDISF